MRKYLRVNEAAKQLNVSPSTLRRYVQNGDIKCVKTPTGQRTFTQEDIDEFLGKEKTNTEQTKAYYVRSSDGDNAKINNQIKMLEKAYGENDSNIIVKDKSSGLNDKRKGLQKLINLSQERKITDIYITQQDRLTRFGYNYLEQLFNQNDVQIHILNDTAEKSLQEELLQDFMSLIASFSGKFYRLRGYEQQKQLLNKIEEQIDEKQKSN